MAGALPVHPAAFSYPDTPVLLSGTDAVAGEVAAGMLTQEPGGACRRSRECTALCRSAPAPDRFDAALNEVRSLAGLASAGRCRRTGRPCARRSRRVRPGSHL